MKHRTINTHHFQHQFFKKKIKAGGKQEERENEINYTLRQSRFRFTTPNSRTHTTFLYELQGSSAVNTTRVLALRQSYVRRLVEKTFRAPHLVKTPSSELAELKKNTLEKKIYPRHSVEPNLFLNL